MSTVNCPSSSPSTPRPTEARVFVPFFIASLLLTLTFGAALGMLNLARLTGTGWGLLHRPSVWAHAYVQVFGFVGLFVMGVAYHVLPRFTGVQLQGPGLARWSFCLQLLGVVLVAAGFMARATVIRGAWLAGAGALSGGALLFYICVTRTLAGKASPPEPFECWMRAGVTWLVAGAALALIAALSGDPAWHQVLWPAALFGFAGSWIFGVGRRVFPIFLGWRARCPPLERPAYWTYQLGVAAWSAGSWPADSPLPGIIAAAGAVALVAGTAMFAFVVGLFTRRDRDWQRGPHERYIYTAWAWLGVGLLLGPIATTLVIFHGGHPAPLVADFARHAVALGFVTMMIVGVAGRVVPVFTGRTLWSPRAHVLTFWFLIVALAVRALQVVISTGYWPHAWPFIGLAGPPAFIAMLLFTINIVMTVRPEVARTPAAMPAFAPGGSAGTAHGIADRVVADLLAIPGVLDLLVSHGFTPLANPVLRATLARTVTLREACRLKQIPLAPLVQHIQQMER
jgi:uncharacterized protein involved in response to NO